MAIRAFLMCFVIFVGAVQGQTTTVDPLSEWLCLNLKTNDCSTHKVDERCGSNNVTYKNRCELGKAYCANDHIHQAHQGPCTNDPNATRSPEEVKHASELIFEIECVRLSHQPCAIVANEKICGTDGYTYQSYCELQKAKCTHRELHVKQLGDCSA